MKILVFSVNWLGDILFSTPLYRAIKGRFPDCFLGVILPPRGRELLEYNPYVDEVLEFDERERQHSLSKKLSFAGLLRKKRYDKAIILHRSFTRALICLLAGIKERIGYARVKRKFVLTRAIKPPRSQLHRQDYYLYLLEQVGIKVGERFSELYISEKERRYAQNLILSTVKEDKKLIAVSPGANWPLKRWPYFSELINLLVKDLNCKVFMTSSESERELTKKVMEEVREDFKKEVIDLTGKTSLLQLAGLFERMDCLISSDSGPLHIASSVGCRVVGIYGPTSPKITSPRTKAKYIILFKKGVCPVPCYERRCVRNLECLRRITPEEVLEKVKEIIEE